MLAEVNSTCGKWYLSVANVIVAMEGDRCRDGGMPEDVMPVIPDEELEDATIGGKPAKEFPIDIIRYFRGDNWTKSMLDYTANHINEHINETIEQVRRL